MAYKDWWKTLKMPSGRKNTSYSQGIYQFLEEELYIPAEQAVNIPFDGRKLGRHLRYKIHSKITHEEYDAIIRLAKDGSYANAIDLLIGILDNHRVTQLKQLKLDRAERQKKISERKKWRDKNEKVD